VMDIFSAIVVVLPLIAPVAKAYGIDPYHLGVIFLLNLEVGYLHPPVGLNLFITSVKFQRPITEVMWATIPFLVTMIVALLTITYVPALTVVPEAERTGTVQVLQAMVHTAAEESKVSVKDLKLVDATGAELKDANGKPIERHFKDCLAIADEQKRGICQQLFFDVMGCATEADEAKIADCTHKKIAAWTVSTLNEDALDQSKAIVVVSEVALVDGEGKPVVDKAGAPIVKKYAECAGLAGSYQETCRELFIAVSSCKISPPDGSTADDCVRDKIVSWVDANPP